MNTARVFFGSSLAALGALLLLDQADVLVAGDVIAAWWPSVVITAGVFSFVSNPTHWLIPLGLVVGGGAMLLRTTEVVDTFAIVGPALLVVVGAAIVLGMGSGARASDTGDTIRSFNAFSGSNLASHSIRFEGGDIGAIFGGAEVDLRDAVPATDASLDVFAAFGGVEIQVPDGWDVSVHGLPLFGGFENVTATESLPPDAPRLDVNATVLFGGVAVKH